MSRSRSVFSLRIRQPFYALEPLSPLRQSAYGFDLSHASPMRLATHERISKPSPPRGPTSRGRQITRVRMRPKKSILCVDGNEHLLSVRKFFLETRGCYRVIPATSSQEALEMLQTATPGSIDLLLSDLLMPQMDGNELVRRAKQLHPGLPAMIISGTVTSSDRATAADVFLPKGASSPSEMLERIRVLVARKRGPRKVIAPTYDSSASMNSFAQATAS